jgi:hypothetical protein
MSEQRRQRIARAQLAIESLDVAERQISEAINNVDARLASHLRNARTRVRNTSYQLQVNLGLTIRASVEQAEGSEENEG